MDRLKEMYVGDNCYKHIDILYHHDQNVADYYYTIFC